MDCCKTKNDEGCCKDLGHNKYKSKNLNGENKMNTRIVLWGVIGFLFVAVLFITFKAGAAGGIETAQAITGAATSASYGMVGGC